MRTNKRLMFIIIAIIFISPIFLARPVQATWLNGSPVTKSTIFQDINPSIAINPLNNSMSFSYTRYLPVNGDSDIFMASNTENLSSDTGNNVLGIPIYDEDKISVSDSGSYFASIYNDHSQIAVSPYANETWVTYEGQISSTHLPVSSTDREIYLFYLSNGMQWDTNITSVAGSTNNTDPQIVALSNTTAIVAWDEYTGTANNIVTTTVTTLSSTQTLSFTRISGGSYTDVQLASSGSPGSEIIHMAYISNGNTIEYTNRTRSGTFSTGISLSTGGIQIKDLKLDVKGNYVCITYMASSTNNIYYLVSDNGGKSFNSYQTALTAGSMNVIDYDSYITAFGEMEVYYTVNVSTSESNIYSINTFNNGAWSTPELLFGGMVNYEYYSPVVKELNNTIIGLYDYNYNPGSGWQSPNLYTFGYELFYDKPSGNYNQFQLNNQDPYGEYLIEGMDIDYNGSVSNVALNFTFTDTVTGNSFSNVTTINASSTTTDPPYSRYLFWDPGHYMITNNTYDLTIRFANTGQQVLRVAIDPSQLSSTYNDQGTLTNNEYFYNITSNDYPNGIGCIYELSVGVSLEYAGTGRFYKLSPGATTNILNNRNYADFGVIQMSAHERYNFTFQTLQSGYVKAYLFNNSVQILNPSKALYTWSRTTNGTTYTPIVCNNSGQYFVLIERENYASSDIGYYFQYLECPGNATLESPTNQTYFNWDINQSVNLNWLPRLSDTNIYAYILQISNDSQFNPANTSSYFLLAAIGHNYTFNAQPEQWYYWRVKVIDTSGDEGFYNQVWSFGFDEKSPDAPQFTPDHILFTNTSFIINWTIPSDHAFTVDYYNLYRSTNQSFIPGPSNMITTEGVNKYPFYTDNVSQNGRYYYYVQAVDHVGHISNFSNEYVVTVSYGGAINAANQTFEALIGDILEYKVTWVQSTNVNSYNQMLMTFRGNTYLQGTVFQFWIKNINPNDVLPVRGDFYSKSVNVTESNQYSLQESDMMLVPFVTDNNVSFQQAALDLYVIQQLPGYVIGINLTETTYNSTWNDGINVRNVVCYNYHSQPDADRSQTSITFMMDAKSGVMLEMIYYDSQTNYGYSLKLIDTTIPLSESDWAYAPFIVPIFIGVVAAVVYAIMKKIRL